MMTTFPESEAFKKQCCGPNNCGTRTYGEDNPRSCQGSSCAAWRWNIDRLEQVKTADKFYAPDEANRIRARMVPEAPSVSFGEPGWRLVGPDPTMGGWSVFERYVRADTGYCGLAGNPWPTPPGGQR